MKSAADKIMAGLRDAIAFARAAQVDQAKHGGSMSIRCGSCGRFIGPTEKYITDYEPLSHFGLEVIDFVHVRCAQVEGQDAEERLDAKHESAVPEGNAP